MDASRKANRDDHEKTLQYASRQEAQSVEDLNQEKLTQLLAYISGLEQTPPGAAELGRRIKLFGVCTRIEGETSVDYYARLRHWLDRYLPQTKSPLHPPRQTGESPTC